MSSRQLHQYTDYDLVLNAVTTATSALQTSASWDMSGFDGCEIIGIVGTAAGSGAATLTYQIGASTTGFVAASGGTAASTGGADDGLLVIDSYKPTKRYGRCTIGSGTTDNISFGGVLVRRYHARDIPTTATSTGDLMAAKTALVGAAT